MAGKLFYRNHICIGIRPFLTLAQVLVSPILDAGVITNYELQQIHVSRYAFRDSHFIKLITKLRIYLIEYTMYRN